MGHILCAVAIPMSPAGKRKKPKVWRIDRTRGFGKTPASYVDDREMVRAIIEYLTDEAQVVVTHYGTYFDLPFVNTRALHWGMKPLPPIAHLDLWKTARKGLALTSNRQATINDLVGADYTKYKPGWEVWRKAQYGDRKALDALTAYCVNDVRGLLDNYEALRPLIQHHPHWSNMRGLRCPACNSTKVQSRGTRRTKRLIIQRIQCMDCGSWSDGGRASV